MVSLFCCSNGQMEGSIEVPIVFGGSGEKSKITDLYELRERCGKRCQEYFQHKIVPESLNPELWKYENHYNKKMNKCFIFSFS